MRTLSTLYSYLIALPLEKRRSARAQMRAATFPLVSLFFALVVPPPHHYFIILVSHKHFTSNSCVFFFFLLFPKIFVILFTCCVPLSGAVHFCTPAGDSLDGTNGTRELKWYSLIDRGARDRECEQNSKTSPETSGGGGGGKSRGGRSMVEWRHRARKLHCVLSD